MQTNPVSNDITAINIQLNELRSKFDHAMRDGTDYVDLRETYLQMKELECYINALQWEPEKQFMVHHHSPTGAWL
jgi:hypothetical protein